MGCKVKNKGRRTIITKNGGNFMEKYIFDEGTVCGMSCRGTNNIRACAAEIVDTEIICA